MRYKFIIVCPNEQLLCDKYFNLETSHINIELMYCMYCRCIVVTGVSISKTLNTDHPIRISSCNGIYKVTFTSE